MASQMKTKGDGEVGIAKAKNGCWTCKQRKVGCDRALPSCHNCSQIRRHCLGYSVRLLWPGHSDLRRKDGGFMVCEPQKNPFNSSEFYGRHFLNFNCEDVASYVHSNPLATVLTSPAVGAARPLSLYPTMIGQDALFMSYYSRVLTPIISTAQVRNGFCTDLVQMSLPRGDTAAKALWNSMMAVSAFHHSGPAAALLYKTNAIRYLSTSLASEQYIRLNGTQLATAMMLCIYSVFDEADGHWSMHLDGAKSMLEKLYPDHKSSIKADFLFTWFLYHEILACFTYPLRQANNCLDVLSLLESSGCDATLILEAAGCSLEAMAIIHRVNKFRIALIRNDIGPKSHKLISYRNQLEHTLRNLVQHLDSEAEAGETPVRRTHILETGELYRIGILLYLFRVVPLSGDEEKRARCLDQAFAILEHLEVATYPWPVFMVACECQTEKQRIQILHTLDLMENVKKTGSLRRMRTLIESCWKRDDLHVEPASMHHFKCWEHISSYKTAVPWFV